MNTLLNAIFRFCHAPPTLTEEHQMISETQFSKLMPSVSSTLRDKYLTALNTAMDRYDIDTPARQAAFLAQIVHESGGLKRVEENLNYSDAGLLTVFAKYFTVEEAGQYHRQPERIANRVYANRMGNGDEASGDGWRFRGRGLIQLTGKNNYSAFARSFYGKDDEATLNKATGWLTEPAGAAMSAAWFWSTNGLNALADRQDLKAMTKKINGGLNGYEDRLKYYEHFCKVLGVNRT